MGLRKFFRKALKVVAIIAVVVGIGMLLSPTFANMVSNFMSQIANSVASMFGTAEAGAGAATVDAAAAAGTAAGETAAAVSLPVAEPGAAMVTELAPLQQAASATAGLPAAGAEAATSGAASGATTPLANTPAPGAAGGSAVPPTTPAPNPATALGPNPATVPTPNPATNVGAGGAGGGGGGASTGILGKALGWVKDNQLVSAVGLKALAGAMQEDPEAAKMRAHMEYEDWARNRLNQSIMGSTLPFDASGPQGRLRRIGGQYVYPLSPRGIIAQSMYGNPYWYPQGG